MDGPLGKAVFNGACIQADKGTDRTIGTSRKGDRDSAAQRALRDIGDTAVVGADKTADGAGGIGLDADDSMGAGHKAVDLAVVDADDAGRRHTARRFDRDSLPSVPAQSMMRPVAVTSEQKAPSAVAPTVPL